MEMRSIGSLSVSLVGLGCNNFGMRLDYGASARVVDAALDAGVTLFDTADVYGQTKSEEFLGRALGARRGRVCIATKFGMPIDDARQGARPEYLQRAIEDSLRRLRTDHVDLYQLHQPDPAVPIADTLGALDALVRAGKVTEIGCSNFSAEQLQEAHAAAAPGAARFASVQNEYSLLHREPEQGVLAASERLGLAFLPYFPLASGLLTGKYRFGEDAPPESRLAVFPWAAKRFATERNVRTAHALGTFATERGHTLLELAMAWLANRPRVASIIAGATSPEQVRANVAAVSWRLDRADLAAVDRLTAGTF